MLEAARPDPDERQERRHWISVKFNDKRTWSDFKKISGYDKEMLFIIMYISFIHKHFNFP